MYRRSRKPSFTRASYRCVLATAGTTGVLLWQAAINLFDSQEPESIQHRADFRLTEIGKRVVKQGDIESSGTKLYIALITDNQANPVLLLLLPVSDDTGKAKRPLEYQMIAELLLVDAEVIPSIQNPTQFQLKACAVGSNIQTTTEFEAKAKGKSAEQNVRITDSWVKQLQEVIDKTRSEGSEGELSLNAR